MVFGMIIIGDEIFFGCCEDKYLCKLIEVFGECGLVLEWVEYVGDQFVCIMSVFKCMFVSDDVVFCIGGIGVIFDDYIC